MISRSLNAREAFNQRCSRTSPERRDALESPSRSFLLLSVSLQTMTSSIPVYRADGSLYAHVSEKRLEWLQSAGLVARVVRHRKGHVNRVILFGRPGEPGPTPPGAYLGTRYIFRERLESGPRCWRHKRLNLRDEDGVSVDGRSVFLRVVQECLAS